MNKSTSDLKHVVKNKISTNSFGKKTNGLGVCSYERFNLSMLSKMYTKLLQGEGNQGLRA